jgi:hypothetical protein
LTCCTSSSQGRGSVRLLSILPFLKLNLLNDDEIPQAAGIGNNDHRERYRSEEVSSSRFFQSRSPASHFALKIVHRIVERYFRAS